MTSLAHIPAVIKISTPFAVICSFQVPSTELEPDLASNLCVCIGEYQTLLDAEVACAKIKRHPALISAWCNKR